MGLKCVICGMAHLPSERCGSDTEAGLAASAKLDRARAALREAERKEGPVEDERAREALAGVREEMRRRAAPPSEPPSAPPAPVKGSGGGAVEQRSGFDRNAYHKTYMKAYMRGWRARRKAGAGE